MKQLYLLLIFIANSLAGAAQTVDFTYQTDDGLFCAPSVVSFTQTCTGNPVSFRWEFENNSQSTLANPVHIFTTPGIYNVRLIAFYPLDSLIKTKTITIVPGDAVHITANHDTICKAGPVNFVASGSSSFQSYEWNFGDGSPLQTTGPLVSHSFNSSGIYKVYLKALAASGCTARDSLNIYYIKPPLNSYVSPNGGCTPVTAGFFTQILVPSGDAIVSYSWNFADGSPVTQTISGNTTHTYTAVGVYFSTLSITTAQGCTASYTLDRAAVGTTMVNYRGYLSSDTICASDLVYAISSADNITATYYNFGDGANYYSADTIRSHKYNALGHYTINFSPDHNGCPGPYTTRYLFVTGTISSFSDSNDCSDKHNFFFTDHSQGNVTAISWNFGDGTVVSNNFNPAHRFANAGAYQVVVTTTDSVSHCSDSYSKQILVSNPKLTSSDTAVCKGSIVTFTVQDSTPRPGATFEWHVAGRIAGPFGSNVLSTTANIPGSFNNYVIVRYGQGACDDTIWQNKSFRVSGPVLAFNMPDSICLDAALQVINTSGPYFPADSIRKWNWNFGLTNAVDSSFQPLPYHYTAAGLYKVRLKAVDKNGCADSLQHNLNVITAPFVDIINPAIDTLCFSSNKTLIAQHTGTLTWTPAAMVSCAYCDTVVISPQSSTMFFATVTTPNGCVNFDSVFVKVIQPFDALASFQDSSICLYDSLQLHVTPANKRITWSPAAGLSSAVVANPLAYPVQSTVYNAILSDSTGCFTDSIDIHVLVNTLPLVNAGPDKVYSYGASINFTPTYSANVTGYKWSPATTLSCATCAIPTGRADASTTYTIKVVSDSGCTASDDVTISALCTDATIYMPGAFSPDNNSLNDYYYPLTKGIKTVKSFLIYNRLGQLVFSAKDFIPNYRTLGWNGKINGVEQPVGTYIYVLEAECDNAAVTRRGSFMLFR